MDFGNGQHICDASYWELRSNTRRSRAVKNTRSENTGIGAAIVGVSIAFGCFSYWTHNQQHIRIERAKQSIDRIESMQNPEHEKIVKAQ